MVGIYVPANNSVQQVSDARGNGEKTLTTTRAGEGLRKRVAAIAKVQANSSPKREESGRPHYGGGLPDRKRI